MKHDMPRRILGVVTCVHLAFGMLVVGTTIGTLSVPGGGPPLQFDLRDDIILFPINHMYVYYTCLLLVSDFAAACLATRGRSAWKMTVARSAIALAAVLAVYQSGAIIAATIIGTFRDAGGSILVFENNGMLRGVMVMDAIIMLPALLVLVVLVLELERRTPPGVCRVCGYDLRGLSRDAPCPECGSAQQIKDSAS